MPASSDIAQAPRARSYLVLPTLCTLALACDSAPQSVAVDTLDRASAEGPIAPPPHVALPKVAFLGDSLAAGLHLARDQAFPRVLQRRLASGDSGFQLIDAAVSGETTAGGLRRIEALLAQQPRVVVVELGADDGLRALPATAIASNLRAIVTKLQAADARVLLLGLHLPAADTTADYARAFEAVYAQLAGELRVPFVPFFMRGVLGRAELTLPDGFHPTPAGHELLANAIAEPLRALLARESAAAP